MTSSPTSVAQGLKGATAARTVDGAADLDPIVLLHSFLLDSRMWAPMMAMMATPRSRIALDLRGHGQASEGGRFSIAASVEDILRFLDATEIERVHLVGLSIGGVVAHSFATAHPERCTTLSLLATLASGSSAISDRIDLIDQFSRDEVTDLTLKRWFTEPELLANTENVQYARDRIRLCAPGLWRSGWAELANLDAAEQMSTISAPTLVVSAAEDASTPTALMRSQFSGLQHAQFVELNGAHLFPLSDPGPIAGVLDLFTAVSS